MQSCVLSELEVEYAEGTLQGAASRQEHGANRFWVGTDTKERPVEDGPLMETGLG